MTHTKKFLISELQRFVKENNRSPRVMDMQGKFGYPTSGAYKSHFVTWNNALLEAGLEVNQQHHTGTLDGMEICNNCDKNKPKNQNWLYHNGQRLCMSCYYKNKTDYKNGNLNPESAVGFAFISQRIVAKTLELDLEHDCNCSEGFNALYDLYDKKLGSINVKVSTLFKDNAWHFGLTNKYAPDTYIMLGFSADKSDILHVWVIELEDDLIFDEKNFKFKQGITIRNTNYSLNKVKSWEVDCEPYNDVYHNMSLENCSVLRSD